MNEASRVHTKPTGDAESICERTKIGKLKQAASAIAFAAMCTASAVHAEPIIFSFNCTLVNATTCTPGPQVATMTLSDSTVDRNRVDIDMIVSSSTPVTTVNRVYLNYGGPTWIHGHYLSIVRQTAPARSDGDETLNSVVLDSLGPFGTGMDILLGTPVDTFIALGLSQEGLSFSGSLVVKPDPNEIDERDLDATGFRVKNVNNMIYAALEIFTPMGVVYAGATVAYSPSDPDVLPMGNINLLPPPDVPPLITQPSSALIQADVPEPGTLGLLGVAAAFLGSAISLKKRSCA